MNTPHALTCEEIDPLLPAAAAGALDPADDAAVQAHVPACPTCRPKLAEYETVITQLAYAVPQVEPPAALRPRLLAALGPAPLPGDGRVAAPLPATRPVLTPVAPRRSLWDALLGAYRQLAPAVFAVAVALLLLVGTWGLSRDRQVGEEQQMLALLRMQGSHAVALLPMTATAATGQMYMAPAADKVGLVVAHLAPPPPGRVYAVWLLMADGHIMPCGTITVDANGVAVAMLHLPADIEHSRGLAITDEPPGAPAPTGTKWLEADYTW